VVEGRTVVSIPATFTCIWREELYEKTIGIERRI